MKINVYMSILLALLWSCKENSFYHYLCEGKKRSITADFHIYEAFNGVYPSAWEVYDTDTVATIAANFVALEEDAIYEWRLGREIIREKSFKRTDFPQGVHISVSLKVTKRPDSICFPNDSVRVATKTRSFYTTGTSRRLLGTFRGYHADEPKRIFDRRLFNIEIERYVKPGKVLGEPWFVSIELKILNLIEGCNTIADNAYYAYKQLYFSFPYRECLSMAGIARIHGQGNDSLTIKYRISPDKDSLEDRIGKVFKGIRIK